MTTPPIEITLPLSKSIGNRQLIIASVGGFSDPLAGVDDAALCDDLRIMRRALFHPGKIIDLGDSATAMRFLVARYAAMPGAEVRLRPSQRLSERPLHHLLEALVTLGANAVCRDGRDILVRGRRMRGGKVRLPGNVSSQYVSALMLAAPAFEQPLQLEIEHKAVSLPYIVMTAEMLENAGVEVKHSYDWSTIEVASGRLPSLPDAAYMELDWSAAAFFYEYVALTGKAVILRDLRPSRIQGDSTACSFFNSAGVETQFTRHGALLTRTGKEANHFEASMVSVPDMVPALAVTLALRGIDFRLTGLASLRNKESDRIAAVKKGLRALGCNVTSTADQLIYTHKETLTHANDRECPHIDHFNDHRIVMAFAMAQAAGIPLQLSSLTPAAKSFPSFGECLKRLNDTRE